MRNKIKGILLATLLALAAGPLALAQSVTLKVSGAPLSEAINSVESSTNYSFFYDSESVDTSTKVSVNAENRPIDEVLRELLSPIRINFEIKGNQIVLTPAKTPSQTRTIRGTVLDRNGEPLIGAGVLIKGTTSGAITGIDGRYEIPGLKEGDILEFSSLGFSSREAVVAKSDVIDIVLLEDTEVLESVVVVGFGTQKRENLTGAVATISAKELNDRPVVNAATALQGLDPSVNITMGTGSPESSYNIDIRGAASINSASPLILVDGIEMDLRAVNPNDIESISVLKDASAASIYGAKASAGVILVTTKTGSSEEGVKRARIKYSGRVGFAQNTTSTDFITCGYDFVTMENYFRQSVQGNTDYFYNYSGDELIKLLERANDKVEDPARPWIDADANGNYKYYANFDWFGYLYNRNRLQHEHNVSVNGGNDNFNYYFSGRYLYNQGIFALGESGYTDYSFRSKVGVKLTPKLKYSNNISFDRSRMAFPGLTNYETTIAYLQNYLSPSFLPFNPDGSINEKPSQLSSSQLGSGIAGMLASGKTFNEKIVRTVTLNNQLDYEIIPELKLTASYGIKMRDPKNRYRNNTYKYSSTIDEFVEYKSAKQVENVYQENHYGLIQNNVDAYLTYKDSYGKGGDHHFTFVAGTQYMDYHYSTMQGKQYDLTNDNLATFAVATGEITLQQSISTLRTLGFFARANYDYKGKYLFEVSGRADGSSRFAPGSRWGFFPSASAGWRISEEKFFEPAKHVMNNLKLRISAGSLGNQQVSSYYAYIDQISTDSIMNGYTFDGSSLPNYASVSDPIASDLTWETVTTYNIGLDTGLFDGRLTFNADAYIRDTDNMLTSAMTLPSVYGANTPKTNYAAMRTTGYELYLRWQDKVDVAGRPFSYGLTATLGDYRTKITKFKNDDMVLGNHYVGQTLGEIWGYHVSGLFSSDKEAEIYQNAIDWEASDAIYTKIFTSKGTDPGQKLLEGDMKFIDTNKDGRISKGSNTVKDPGDRMIIGNSLPRWSYSFRFDLNWYGFDLSAFFQGVGHQDWYPNISSDSGKYASDFFGPYANPMTSFVHKDFDKYCWTETNKDGYFPRQRGYIARADGPLGNVNDYYLQNVAYIRLKNLSLGYTVPFKKVAWIDSLRVAFNGENLWYWSPIKKYCKTVDPELTLSSSTNASNTGVGYFYSKVFTFSVDINF
ncbi:MAG: TonB-dependent receptor [Bacteroidales bacterium]|nr:TonB-dependent receptor [Bacteroidales bacterium]